MRGESMRKKRNPPQDEKKEWTKASFGKISELCTNSPEAEFWLVTVAGARFEYYRLFTTVSRSPSNINP